MLRNSFNDINRDQRRLVDLWSERMINFSAYVHCCDVCSSTTKSSTAIECTQFMSVFYDCLSHFVKAVKGLLLRLHQTTCFLLHLTPASKNEVYPLPDILNDLNFRPICSVAPDVKAIRPKACGTTQTEIAIIVHPSARDLDKGCHKYGNHLHSNNDYSNPYINNTIRYYHKSKDQHVCNNNIRHGQEGMDCIEDNNDDPVCDCIRSARAQSQNSATPADNTVIKPCLGYGFPALISRTTNNILGVSRQSLRNQESHQTNGHDQKLIVPDSLQTQVLTCSQSNPTDVIVETYRAPDSQASVHIEQVAHNVDREFMKDIVLALRSVGDNLDSRMRSQSEPSFQAVLGASKIRGGWFLLMILKQHSVIDVMTSMSLELVYQFSPL